MGQKITLNLGIEVLYFQTFPGDSATAFVWLQHINYKFGKK